MFRSFVLSLLLLTLSSRAETFTTNSGKTWRDVSDIAIRGEVVSFVTDTAIVKIPLSDFPLELQTKYLKKAWDTEHSLKQKAEQSAAEEEASRQAARERIVAIADASLKAIGKGVKSVHTGEPAIFALTNAPNLADLAKAQEQAIKSGRPLGFLMVAKPLFGTPCDPRQAGPLGAFAQIFASFEGGVILVFVPLEDTNSMTNLPYQVAGVLSQPTSSLAAPRLVLTDPRLQRVIADLQIKADDTAETREQLIYGTAVKLKEWYQSLMDTLAK